MTRWLLPLLILAVPALALEPDQLNPSDTDAKIYNKLYLECQDGNACLNIYIHSANPDDRNNKDFWIVDDGDSIHNICYRIGDADYCVEAIAE